MEEKKLASENLGDNVVDLKENKEIVGIGDLITDSFKNFWGKFLIFVRLELFKIVVTFAIFLVFVIVAIVIGLVSGSSMADVQSGAGGLATWALVVFVLLGVLMVTFLIVFSVWSEVAYAEISTYYHEKIGVIDSYKRSWSKTSMYFGTMLAKELVLIGGYLFFIIPGIIFSVWFAFTEFIVIRKEASGVNALMLSKKYVGGKWWDVFLRLLILIAIIIAFALGMGVGEEVINIVLSLVSNASDNETVVLIVGIILIVVTVAIRLVANIVSKGWSLIYRSFLYDNFKKIKGELSREITESKWWLYLSMIVFILIIVGAVVLSGSLIALINNYNSGGDITTNRVDTTEESMSDVVSDANLRASDHELRATAANISTALETYYTINGYYPYTESLSNLWEGDKAVLDMEPSLPYQCGSLDMPTSECGIVYEWQSEDGYSLRVDYIMENEETIYGGEYDMTQPVEEI